MLWNLLYTPFIGIPACILCMTLGCMACVTIILIPVGLTMFALGFKVLTI